MEKIINISFKKINSQLYLIVYYDNCEIKRIKVKDKYKDDIFYLITNIYFDK